MASISRQPNGRRTIQFNAADGSRRSIRLGKVSQRAAETIKFHVERLVVAAVTGYTLEDETVRWVSELEDTMRDKLAAAKLVQGRESAALGAFVDAYIAGRKDAKPATITTFKRCRNKLLDYFPVDKRLRDITAGDADDFARWLRLPGGGRLSEATARKTVSITKQIFRAALRKKSLTENPFADLSGTVPANRERDFYVTREMSEKILAECPDAEWRLLFALARFGGLRCPSETLGLRLADIDWAQNRMTVRSPKTEHRKGGASRVIPIFPELQPYLLAAYNNAPDGAEYVIGRYRNNAVNLRTQLTRIIRRAGLEPWPKLWQNLRATRETELAEKFPAHVVSAWIGHSQIVAAKHYLQVTDEHFERAASAGEALQNPVRQPHATSRNESQQVQGENDKAAFCNDLRQDAAHDEGLQCTILGVTGLEPVTSSV